MIKFYLILTFILGISCTKIVNNQLYSQPKWEQNPTNLKQVVIAITNNEDGLLKSESTPLPNEILRPESASSIKFGGPAFLSSYIDILRKRFSNQLVLLDTGRFLKETSNQEEKTSLIRLYKHLNYDALLFTEEEVVHFLDSERKSLDKELPYINSNIINLRSKKNLTKSVIADSKILVKNGVKIGIIGLTSYEGRKVSTHDSFKGIYFEKPAVTFLEYKNKLKKKGAEVIVLMANLKTSCKSKMPPRTLNSPRPTWAKIHCEDKADHLLKFLKRIPRGSLDLLILANSDYQLRGYLFDTPVVSTPPSSGYMRMVEIFFDKNKKELIWDKSLLHPKLKLCQSFFTATSDCHLGAELDGYKDRLQLIQKSALQNSPAKFLGHEVRADISVLNFLPILR